MKDLDGEGLFIVIDGPDGCGKTSMVKYARDFLDRNGILNEPLIAIGQGEYGRMARHYVVNNAQDQITETAIFAAAHLVAYNDEIMPRLKAGRSVVMDRWISSLYAYQAVARENWVAKSAYEIYFANNKNFSRWPDLFIIGRVDPKVAMNRMVGRNEQLTHFDQEKVAFKDRVSKGYEDFIQRNFNRVETIDCNKGKEHVEAILEKKLTDLLIRKSIKPL